MSGTSASADKMRRYVCRFQLNGKETSIQPHDRLIFQHSETNLLLSVYRFEQEPPNILRIWDGTSDTDKLLIGVGLNRPQASSIIHGTAQLIAMTSGCAARYEREDSHGHTIFIMEEPNA